MYKGKGGLENGAAMMKIGYEDFSYSSLKAYADLVHQKRRDDIPLPTLLELIKFLIYEGKCGLFFVYMESV